MASQLSDAFHSCPSQLEEQEEVLEDDESDNESQALLSPVNELPDDDDGGGDDDDRKMEEKEQAIVETSATTITTTNNNNRDTSQEAVTDLWNTLYAELNNVGKSMSCPLCLSTYQNPVLLPCVHAFCRCCIQRSFADGRKKCPICNQTATKRSLVDAPSLQNLATAYKHVLRSFGMTPIVYDPDFIGLTQLPPEEDEEEEDDENANNNNQDTTHSNTKTKNPSLLDCHTHLEVSKTWHRVLSTTTKKQNTSFLLKEQERVLKADEKALVRAAVRQKRQRTKLVLPPPDDDERVEQEEDTTLLKKNPTMVSFATDTTMIHPKEDEDQQEKGSKDDYPENVDIEVEQQQPQQVAQEASSMIVEEQIPIANQASENITHDETQQNQYVVEEKEIKNHDKTTTTTFKTPEPLPPTLSQLLEESRDREAADQSAEEWMEEEQQQQQQKQTIIVTNKAQTVQPKEKQHMQSSQLSSVAGYETAQSSLAESSSMAGITASQQLEQQPQSVPVAAAAASVETLNATNVILKSTTPSESQASLPSFQTAQPLVQGGDSSDGVTTDSTVTTTTTTAEGEVQSVVVPSSSSKSLLLLPEKREDTFAISSDLERVQNDDNTNSVSNIVDNDNLSMTKKKEKETVEQHPVNSDIYTTAKEQATDSKSSKPCPAVEHAHEMFDFEPNMDNNDGANITSTALSCEETTTAVVEAVPNSDPTNNDNVRNPKKDHDNQNDEKCDSTNKTDKENAAIPAQNDGIFAVGTVVQVQARTWPGVNKQGGVGRITKLHVDDDGGGLVSYDVKYILGGREKKVDATFVKPNETNQLGSNTTASTAPLSTKRSSPRKQHEDTTATATAVRGRKSRRITVTTQKKEQDEIPPQLLAELAAAGFDTKCMGVKNKSAKKATSKTIPKTTTVAKGKAASKDKTRVKQKTKKSSSTAPTKTKRKFGLLKHQNDMDNQGNKTKTKVKQPAKKRAKVATSLLSKKKVNEVQTKTMTTTPTSTTNTSFVVDLPPLTDSEKCQLANERYHEYFTNALQTSVINVVSSGLSEQDNEMLQVLCKQTKKSTVKVKLAKEFHPHKTTICVVPLEQHGAINEEHAMSRNRTLKVMRAQLAGIPIVPPAWVTLCIQQEKVVEPTSSMYIRTLPTKTEQLVATTTSDTMPKIQLGVANHAARVRQLQKGLLSSCSSVNVLENVFVFLCGRFDASTGSPRKADVTLLLREAGATILSSNAMVNKKLKTFSSAQDGSPSFTLVMLCDASTSDAQCGLSDGLAAACKKSVRESENLIPSGRLLVVHSPWLFDSITCGTKVTGDAYEPCSPRCKELWTICQAKTLINNS